MMFQNQCVLITQWNIVGNVVTYISKGKTSRGLYNEMKHIKILEGIMLLYFSNLFMQIHKLWLSYQLVSIV
jgi:hypothetical protein